MNILPRLWTAFTIIFLSLYASGADQRTIDDFCQAEELMSEGSLDRCGQILDSILSLPGFEHDTMYARVLVEKSTLLYYRGNLDGVKEYALKASTLLDSEGDQIVNASLWNNLAVVYNRNEQTDSALICYTRALEHARRSGDLSWEAALESNIGSLYYNRRKFAKARDFFSEAATHAAECEDGYTELTSSQLLAMALLQLKETEAAGAAIRHAWSLAIESEDPSLQLRCIPGLYGYFEDSGSADSADTYMRLGQKLLPMVSEGGSVAGGYRSAKTRWDISRGRYREALAELDTLRSMPFAPPRNDTYRQKAECFAALGDHQEAYIYLDSALMWTDTLTSRQMEKSLAEFEVKYDTMQKDLSNRELANKVLIRERAMLWLALCLSIAIALGLFLFTRQKRLKNKLELERSRSYIQGMEQERRTFARELHDGVAADLLALRLNLSDGNGANARAAEMAERLRSTVRSISHQLMPPEFGEHTLGEIIKRYVDNIAVGEGPGTLKSADFVEADMPRGIAEHTCREIYRIFQEEMSNILRHGHPSHIDVALQGSPDGTVTLTIDHDSSEPAPEDCTGSHGIGHRTIEDRLRIIGARLERSNTGHSSSTKLTLKLK